MTEAQAKKLREPFPASAIGKLPKPTKADNPKGNCAVCGGYHGLPAVHLDYVGHAATCDRLLSVDPAWTWEPMAVGPNGEPLMTNGGMWIKLTVCGVTRPGFGDGKTPKEIIGDAIRNAAMRFGVALDLWAKEDLHEISAGTPPAKPAADHNPPAAGTTPGAPPEGTDGQAAPAGGAPVTTIELVALYKLVREKGGDVEKTQAGAHTAEEQGKLPAWYAKAKAYWEAQPRSYANKVPAKAKAAS